MTPDSLASSSTVRGLLFFAPDDASGGSGGEGQTFTIGPDDSIISIAKANGFFWQTVWDHPNNSSLKSLRKVPEVVQSGDKVYVPKAEPKKVSKPSEARHKFKLKGEQAKFKMRFKQLGQPRANEDYIMVIDGVIKTGKTDADGEINTDIPNDARGGEIKLNNGKEIIPFRIGRLDPKDSASGVRQRLVNVGYPMDDDPGESVMPKNALSAFQNKNKLPLTGEYDGATKAKLNELHPT